MRGDDSTFGSSIKETTENKPLIFQAWKENGKVGKLRVKPSDWMNVLGVGGGGGDLRLWELLEIRKGKKAVDRTEICSR